MDPGAADQELSDLLMDDFVTGKTSALKVAGLQLSVFHDFITTWAGGVRVRVCIHNTVA